MITHFASGSKLGDRSRGVVVRYPKCIVVTFQFLIADAFMSFLSPEQKMAQQSFREQFDCSVGDAVPDGYRLFH